MSNKEKSASEDNEKITLYKVLRSEHRISYSPEDIVFCILTLAGMPAAQAYRASYPTSATLASSACLASRKVSEPHIQTMLSNAVKSYHLGVIALKVGNFHGRLNWPRYLGRKKQNL